ncbi:primosomal protein N' (replication factor Y) - superfamily II helicase [Cereibacter sphaeroides]|uniref:primosomal protein N' (replication factor Y) - superfamily II helicase n=1 Tax=Cereibacter sphaeroides TaxID=1063 RepID=UPI001F4524CC|nr:primosomal protein N' (replication factor Y) - superfamily II helicase [Cereibacter sphaeroides]MCE6952036.1 primosomal protein N' (replication factor Y) - superfamily II helicase [Cereibacter sphaeroides]
MTDVRHWPCDACGADLRFAPGQTQLVCDHCGHVQKIPEAAPWETARLRELPLADALADRLPASDSEMRRTTPCPSCGALVEFEGATHATRCPFCATPVVVGTGETRLIKPQALIPFQLTEREAREAMVGWLGRLWFAPNGLQQYARKGRALSGIYVPYWTFDAATRSRYTGQRGDAYYTTRTVTVKVDGRPQQRTVTERHIRWTPVSGHVARDFDDVLVMASHSLPRSYTEGLAPWDLSALTPYRADWLAGFTAEGYTVGLAEAWEHGKEIMAQVIRGDVVRDIGGDEQQVHGVQTSYAQETFKHVLLPVWMAAYRYNGKSYRFVVNGQTGRVQGERPWSVWKIAFAVVVALILAGIAAYVAQHR